jgi:hypothetical protein
LNWIFPLYSVIFSAFLRENRADFVKKARLKGLHETLKIAVLPVCDGGPCY